MTAQSGILAPVPRAARYLTFHLAPGADPRPALARLARHCDGRSAVIGLGQSLIDALGVSIPGLRPFPALSGAGADAPSTPAALWCWLRGDDRGDLLHESRRLCALLADAFIADVTLDAFQFRDSRDLTGYEDGTENPAGDAALAAAIVAGAGKGLDGSSFVAVQQWQHDLDRFAALGRTRQDQTFGRRRSDNREMASAPPSAHVKRTAQESFTPPAFVLRRSMPWASADAAGLVFVAFGASFAPFEALLRRMLGHEDGIVDALFLFTRPLSGSYFWCPPVRNARLDLTAVLQRR